LSSLVHTPSKSSRQGNNKGIDDITSHEDDKCLVELNISCDHLPTDLITPLILEDYVAGLNLPCDRKTEITNVLSAPVELVVYE
jgi:hypothetical protein